MYQHLIFENTDGILRIMLNRPQVYHALSPDLISEITIAIKSAESDDSVRVVIITGQGDKAFCSGADLKDVANSGKTPAEILREYYNPMIQAIRTIPKPVICKLNGLAVGAGCSLALACDLVIAQEDTYLSLLFVQIGLMPDAGATFFLPRLIGAARAFEIASTGRKVQAPEAASIGLISQSVPASELDAAVEKAAQHYRSAATKAIGAMKLVMNQSFHSDLAQMQELELINQENLFQTADVREGISAFLQKKAPDFQGR